MHISISEFVIPLCCRYQVVLSYTCNKEYSQDIQFLATSPYDNLTTNTSCESPRTYNSCLYHNLTVIKKTSTNLVLDCRNYFQACWGRHRSLHVYCCSLSRIAIGSVTHSSLHVYCCSLSLIAIGSITDASNDIKQTENNKQSYKCANYHFNKFTASAFLCSLIISAESTA